MTDKPVRPLVATLALCLVACDGSALFEKRLASSFVRDTRYEVWPKGKVIHFRQPADAIFATPASVDYVAIMRLQGSQTRRGYSVKVYRSANLIREDLVEDGRGSTSISDIKSGASIRFAGTENARRGFSAFGAVTASQVEVRWTGRDDHVLGEHCKVWSFLRDLVTQEKCVTSDGVVLWQKDIGSEGVEMRGLKIASLVRRPVRPEELEVPRDLLEWRTWINDNYQQGGSQPNDQVILEGTQFNGKSVRRTIRRLGRIETASNESEEGVLQGVFWDNAAISFAQDANGNFKTLSISRLKAGPPPSMWSAHQPLIGYDVSLERRCVWRLTIGTSEGETKECRTSDGLLLKSSNRYISSVGQLTAKSVTVGRLSESDLIPPNEWLNVTNWTKVSE